MRRKGVVFHRDLKADISTDDSPVKKIARPDFGNISGICRELFPSFHAAKIVSPRYGTFMVAYSQSSGIREGDLVAISISNGIPVAVRTLRMGFTPEKILLLNLEPEEGEDPLSTLKSGDIGWDETIGEQIGLEPVAIKAIGGEKVFNVGLNGIKIGHSLLTLFSSARTKCSFAPNLFSIISPSFKFITMAGSIISKYKDGKGYMSRSILQKSDNSLYGIMHNIEGDIEFGLESLNIKNIRIPGLKEGLSHFISLRLVLDLNLEKYKTKTNTVTHSYKNRELSVDGEGSEGRNIHFEIKKLLFINGILEKYSSGVATVNGKDRPVTFFEGISISGDVFTFSAGEHTVVDTKTRQVTLNEINCIELGQKNVRSQGDELYMQFPVSTKSTKTSMFYGVKTELQYGDEVRLNYRNINSVKINTRTEYDIDKDSGIETKEKLISPVRSIESTNEEQTFTENKDIDKVCEMKLRFSGKSEDSYSIKPDGTGLSYTSVQEKKNARFKIGIEGLFLHTSGDISIKGTNTTFDSKLTVFSGRAQFNEGITALKNFSVSATDINISAEKSISFIGKNVNFIASEAMAFQYKKSLAIASTYAPIVNKKPTQSTLLICESNNISMQSETVSIQGAYSVSVTATKTASFGAEQTSISGMGE
jgi:hypothetical protein